MIEEVGQLIPLQCSNKLFQSQIVFERVYGPFYFTLNFAKKTRPLL